MIIDPMGSWTARRPTALRPGNSFIDEAIENGVTAMAETVIADVDRYDLHEVLRRIDDFHWMLHIYQDRTLLVEQPEDLRLAEKEGKLGMIAMLQGGNAVFEDLAILRMLHRLGIRSIALTYMTGNALGCGCQDLNDTGLTRLGQKVIREMNRIGIAADLSHVGSRTSMDILYYSEAPVIYTHSNIRAVSPHPRNVSDEHLDLLKENGGLICITPVSAFCKKPESTARPAMDDFIDHIAYAADRIGIEHVGIATDRLISDCFDEAMILSKSAPEMLEFDLSGKHVSGFAGFGFWSSLKEALSRRGFGREEIRGLTGENYYRTVCRIWQ